MDQPRLIEVAQEGLRWGTPDELTWRGWLNLLWNIITLRANGFEYQDEDGRVKGWLYDDGTIYITKVDRLVPIPEWQPGDGTLLTKELLDDDEGV